MSANSKCHPTSLPPQISSSLCINAVMWTFQSSVLGQDCPRKGFESVHWTLCLRYIIAREAIFQAFPLRIRTLTGKETKEQVLQFSWWSHSKASPSSGCFNDRLQMSMTCPTSIRQTRDQEAAVRQTFHFERSSLFYLTTIIRTQRSASLPAFSTQLH